MYIHVPIAKTLVMYEKKKKRKKKSLTKLITVIELLFQLYLHKEEEQPRRYSEIKSP